MTDPLDMAHCLSDSRVKLITIITIRQKLLEGADLKI